MEFNEEALCYGSDMVEFNPGVIEFFKDFKREESDVKHFILTSGLETFVRKTEISSLVDDIFGSKIKFVDNDPKLDYILTDDKKPFIINEIIKENYSNVTYLGDGVTDLPAFKHVKEKGGSTIFVGNGKVSKRVINSGSVDHYFDADFTKDSKLYNYLRKK